MPQEDVRGVEGGIDPSTLSGGKYIMAVETANEEGKVGLVSSIEEVFSLGM